MLAPPQPWPRPPRLQDTSMAPQKATFWTPGWAARTGPREAGPLITLRIPGNGPSSPASWARRRGVGEAGGTRTTTVQPGGSTQLKTQESRPPGPSSPNPGVRNPCPSSLRPRGPAPADHLPTASAGQILHIMSRKGKVGGRMRPITPAGRKETGRRPRGEGEGSGGKGLGLRRLTHGLPACQRLLLGVRLDRVVLQQLLGQGHIPVSNFSNGPSSNQGLQGPQQPLVLLDRLGQPVEHAAGDAHFPPRLGQVES